MIYFSNDSFGNSNFDKLFYKTKNDIMKNERKREEVTFKI